MQIIVAGRHLDVADELRTHVAQKLEKLTRFYDRIESIDVVLDRDGEVPIVEAIVNAERGLRFVARESGVDVYAALDLVVDKLSRQLTKHKERFRNRKHQAKRSDKTLEAEFDRLCERQQMKLCDFIAEDAIVVELQSTDRNGVLREMVQSLADHGRLGEEDVEPIVRALVHRENQGSTGFGKGVAVPHVKHERVKGMVGTIARSSRGVDFAALDRAPVYTVVLLLSPTNEPDKHLEAMENLFRHLQKDTFRKFLRQSTSAAEIVDLIREADETPAR